MGETLYFNIRTQLQLNIFFFLRQSNYTVAEMPLGLHLLLHTDTKMQHKGFLLTCCLITLILLCFSMSHK